MTIRVSRWADSDLRRAIRFYDERPMRYGKVLRRDFRTALARIVSSPKLFPLVEEETGTFEVREYFIERFEQRVIYSIRETEIVVVAILHSSNALYSWAKRLENDE